MKRTREGSHLGSCRRLAVGLLIIGTVALAAGASAVAAAAEARVKVPFEFIVADKVLPAGTYTVVSDLNGTVRIEAPDGRTVALVWPQVKPDSEPAGNKAHLSFARFNGHYFLKEIAIPGENTRWMAINAHQAERTLAKLNLLPAEVTAAPVK